MKDKALEAVIDSVTMNVAVRPHKPSLKSKRVKKDAGNPLEKPISRRRLKLALDANNGLQSEWIRSCGPSAIKALVVHCEQYDGIRLIKSPLSPGPAASKKLRLLGFGNDATDKLILKIALATDDRIIVSGESDFWDPKKPNDRTIPGQPNAPVARFCREQLGVTILLLKMLIARVD
jgi:hypothetical protein